MDLDSLTWKLSHKKLKLLILYFSSVDINCNRRQKTFERGKCVTTEEIIALHLQQIHQSLSGGFNKILDRFLKDDFKIDTQRTLVKHFKGQPLRE